MSWGTPSDSSIALILPASCITAAVSRMWTTNPSPFAATAASCLMKNLTLKNNHPLAQIAILPAPATKTDLLDFAMGMLFYPTSGNSLSAH
jgi:hypothetical protein